MDYKLLGVYSHSKSSWDQLDLEFADVNFETYLKGSNNENHSPVRNFYSTVLPKGRQPKKNGRTEGTNFPISIPERGDL